MIRVIFGHYSSSNPLFGFNMGQIVNATDIQSKEVNLFVDNLIDLCNSNDGDTYNFYIGTNGKLVKELAKRVNKENIQMKDMLLVYDNGNKFWGIEWDMKNIDLYLKAMKEDIEIGMI